ncbi:MAG: HEAT repeat domain-containing protein [Tepidisphaeraceae bacterium]
MGRRIVVIAIAVVLGSVLGAAAVSFLTRTRDRNEVVVRGFTMSYWLNWLDSDDAPRRAEAAAALPQFGAPAIEPLVELLGSEHPPTRQSAADALFTLGPPAVPELTAALGGKPPAKQILAIEVLQKLGGASAPAADDIAQLLEDPAVGPSATEFFLANGVAPAATAKAIWILDKGDPSRRFDAIRLLRKAPTDEKITAALLRALHIPDPGVADQAFFALCDLKPPPREAIAAMIERLKRPSMQTAAQAALTSAGAPAIDALRALRQHPDQELRAEAVRTLGQMLSTDRHVVIDILQFLLDPNPLVESTTRGVLSPVVQANPKFLLDQLQSEQVKIRVWAVRELKLQRPLPLDELAEAMEDPSESVRDAATDALRMTTEARDPNWLTLIKSPDVKVRIRAARMLPFVREVGKQDALLLAMDDKDVAVRRAAVGALGRAINSQFAVDRLIKSAAREKNPAVRAAAVRALTPARLLPDVQAALEGATWDLDPAVVAAAQQALGRDAPNP